MIDIILGLLILGLIGLNAWEKYQSRIERSKLINAVLAKNPQDFKDMELGDKTTIKVEAPKIDPNLPMESLTDDQWFDTVIKGKKVR